MKILVYPSRNILFFIGILWLMVSGPRADVPKISVIQLSFETLESSRLLSLLSTRFENVDRYQIKMLNRIAHNPEHFVQGLQLHNDVFWEGTGIYGKSKLLKNQVDWSTRRLILQHEIGLPEGDFGEGIAIIGNTLFQLTWREGRVYQYDISGSVPVVIGVLFNDKQGWGLTSNGQQLIASDGSHILTIRSQEDFRVEDTIEVKIEGQVVGSLNELEFIDGKIWANVWKTPFIVVIDPATGRVVSVIDCRNLVSDARAFNPYIDVLNGIAWDKSNRRVYLTGKNWPWIYEVTLVERMKVDQKTLEY